MTRRKKINKMKFHETSRKYLHNHGTLWLRSNVHMCPFVQVLLNKDPKTHWNKQRIGMFLNIHLYQNIFSIKIKY